LVPSPVYSRGRVREGAFSVEKSTSGKAYRERE
jgi:hypothetical protein